MHNNVENRGNSCSAGQSSKLTIKSGTLPTVGEAENWACDGQATHTSEYAGQFSIAPIHNSGVQVSVSAIPMDRKFLSSDLTHLRGPSKRQTSSCSIFFS